MIRILIRLHRILVHLLLRPWFSNTLKQYEWCHSHLHNYNHTFPGECLIDNGSNLLCTLLKTGQAQAGPAGPPATPHDSYAKEFLIQEFSH